MCSHFLKRMDNYQGDLTDILRAGGAGADGGGGVSYGGPSGGMLDQWQFSSNPIIYPAEHGEDFGDPFTQLGDPLLHDIDTPVPGFFNGSDLAKSGGVDEGGAGNMGGFVPGNVNGLSLAGHEILNNEMKRPSNIFSRMLQISAGAKMQGNALAQESPALAGLNGAQMLVSNDHGLLSSPNSSKGCLVESPAGLQISSPRITGLKRRKSQAKKVVSIPAPAPANSRSSGEVVPSDLWAWRKYGQKPIKGSPYPRGYYRCSSSKGCSARKQVERSRTDPNMLVITYTSEHNHPWPTQRNALAGSTRSQPSKTNTAAASKNNSNNTNKNNNSPAAAQKELEQKQEAAADFPAVKEESDQFDNQWETEDAEPEFDHQGFPPSYKPAMPESNQSEDSFVFGDLGEIEADSSLDILFPQGFPNGRDSVNVDKSLDPFSFYDDWAGHNNDCTAETNGSPH